MREDDRQNENWDDDRDTGTQQMGSHRQPERGSSYPAKPRKKK